MESVWRFGDAEFDEAQGKLTVEGRAHELDRNCAAILGVLLHEAGRDVAKERLLQAGWPDRIVHENSLAKAIGRLRRTLGDQGGQLESVYGVGYRLATEAIRVVEPVPEPVPARIESPTVAAAPRQARAWIAITVLAALAGLAATYALVSPAQTSEPEFRTTPPVVADAPDAIGRLLWVDDHPQNNIYEKRYFEDRRIAVHTVTSSTDALRLLAMYDYDVVVSDMGRGEDRLAGIRLVEQMRAASDNTPFVIYTVRPDTSEAQEAQRRLVAEAGAQGVAVTPQEIRGVILRLFGDPAPRAET